MNDPATAEAALRAGMVRLTIWDRDSARVESTSLPDWHRCFIMIQRQPVYAASSSTTCHILAVRDARLFHVGIEPVDPSTASDDQIARPQGHAGRLIRSADLTIARSGPQNVASATAATECQVLCSQVRPSRPGASGRYPTPRRTLAFAAPRLCDMFSRYSVSFSTAITARSALGIVMGQGNAAQRSVDLLYSEKCASRRRHVV